jgi:hypothetical protein
VLPRARRYALDRIPTVGEIREIIDAADIREKALPVFVPLIVHENLYYCFPSNIVNCVLAVHEAHCL